MFQYVLLSDGPTVATGASNWTQNLADFTHLWGFATVPANAAYVYLEVRMKRTSTAQNTDLWVALPYLGFAPTSQTSPTPWHAGPKKITSENKRIYMADLSVDTLQIAGDAVIVPIRFEAYVAPAESPGATGILTEIERNTSGEGESLDNS